MPRLLIIKGPNVGVSYELGERARIGRLGENEIQVPDPNVSRIHAEIIYERDSFVVYDRGSKNGVIINGTAVPEKALEPGDQIIIGGSTFLFDGEIDIHNARFSDNSVFYLARSGKSKASAKTATGLDETGTDQFSTEIMRLAEIFSGPPASVPVVSERICERIRDWFDADHTVLFLQDHPEGELMPIEAVPHNTSVSVNSALLLRVIHEKRALALTDELELPAGCELADDEQPDPAGQQDESPASDVKKSKGTGKEKCSGHPPVTMLCAPLLSESESSGALLVIRAGANSIPLQGLAVLQSMATLTNVAVRAAITADRARNSAPSLPLDPEQRHVPTRSLRMQEIYNSARRSADGTGAILITGESGTGKKTLAQFIHENGPRSGGPFMVVNCAAIAPEHFEAELFGSERQADDETGHTIPGKVEQAMGGTLFLEEVGELDLSLQPKLLRFLQDRAFYRAGSTRAIESDIKITAGTTTDLAAAVRAGKFREDLWYRLNVVPFHMPPLRERREDIAPLVDFFINRYSARLNRKVLGANDGALALLQKYDWPGNIRELENSVERAVLLAESKVLSTADFSHIEEARRRLNTQADLERKRDTKPLAEVERQHIIIALKKHNFNQARAAEALGLHRNTLRNKIIEYGIEIPK